MLNYACIINNKDFSSLCQRVTHHDEQLCMHNLSHNYYYNDIDAVPESVYGNNEQTENIDVGP